MTTISAIGRSFVENTSVRYGGVTVGLFEIRLDKRATEAIEVGYRLLPGTGSVATSPLENDAADVYGFLQGSVTFQPGQASKTIYRRIASDDMPEDPESVVLELTGVLNGADAEFAGGGATTQATSWIYDDDSGTGRDVVYKVSELVENPDGTQDVVVGVFNPTTTKGTLKKTLRTVDGTAEAGTDYVPVTEFMSFTRSAVWGVANPQFFSLTVLPDAKVEGPEDFFFELGGSWTRPARSDAFTIEDTPPPPLVLGSNLSTRETGTRGDDLIDLSTGADTFFASDGDDIVLGGDGRDKIVGGFGDDRLEGGRNFDELRGGAGDDILQGDGGDDLIYGGIGNDVLVGGANNDILDGGEGDDKLFDDGGNDILRGGEGADRIDGGVGADRLFGGDGDDFIFGGDGDDIVDGGAGNDSIEGGRGNNILAGGDGDDVVYGSTGDDILRGGAGNDLIIGGDGTDILFGGDGDDELRAEFTSSRFYRGQDTLHGGAGNDLLVGTRAEGSVLFGGTGDDILIGGGGGDSLTGGAGSDTFVFGRYYRAANVIEDFRANDFIDLTLLNEDLVSRRLSAYEFKGELSLDQGLAMGAGTLWVTNNGDKTWLLGQNNADRQVDYRLEINDGVAFAASDYTADMFIL